VIRAVLLDIDGTLVDTNYLHLEAWARAFREIGLSIPRSVLHRHLGKGSDQFLPTFVHDEVAAAQADRRHGEIFATLRPHAYVLPGAAELVASLAHREYAVWLATSAKPEELGGYLDQLGGRELLAGAVTSRDVEHSKPAPDVFAVALQRAGVAPDEAVVVGDTVWDIASANQIGLRTVGVLTGGAFSRTELAEAGAVAVYDDCAALLADGFPENL